MWIDPENMYINRSQTHECGNWGSGRAIPRKGIYKRNCRCSACLTRSFLSLPSSHRMSSRSQLTLHCFDIYYLSEFNYDPATTALIFNINPGGLTAIFNPFILSGSLFTLWPCPARFTALFWLASMSLFTLGFCSLALRKLTYT